MSAESADRLLWSGWCASEKGIRGRNEDCAYRVAGEGWVALAVADGVGGEPFGHRASKVAALCAARSLQRSMRRALQRGLEPELEPAVRRAFRWAQWGLRREAFAMRRLTGLKTTLLLALGWKSRVAYGFVGDGGIWCAAAGDAALKTLLHPMRCEFSGELTGVLAPGRRANPVTGVVSTQPGMQILLSTDGLADPIPEEGWRVIANQLRAATEPASVMQHLFESCLALREEGEPVFSDNMTLGLLRCEVADD